MRRRQVRVTHGARCDFLDLVDATAEKSMASATAMVECISRALRFAALAPFSCRVAATATSPRYREAVVPTLRGHGCVVLFEIESDTSIAILAARAEAEDDRYE